jgi:hypothetical protein
VRFWQTDKVEGDGRPIWVGSAVYDQRVGLSRTTGQVTHVTAADVDAERDYLFQCLEQTGDLAERYVVPGFHETLEGRNGGGDPWHTDGNLDVGVIKPALAQAGAPRHVMVYHQRGRFGGWPANHGIWSWGDEILVGFSVGIYKDLGPERHAIDRDRPELHLLARSRDGGFTWRIENPAMRGALVPAGKALHGVVPTGMTEKPWRDCPGGIDFTHPDFALTVRMTDIHAGPSRFYYSTDRGHNWEGPFRLPLFDQKGIAARTDYVVNGKHDCMLFLTAAKQNGREGRPLCVRTTDGGRIWQFVAWIADEPKGYSIMPSTVRLGENELLTAIRRREDPKKWLETYRSLDNGRTWKLDTVPAPDLGEGNPASMIRLADGRVCLTYGHRAAPFAIRARLSSDGGRTWGDEITLRDDGGGRDIGYPRSVQRPDGKVVTVYYFWDQKTGPERYIAATIWDPGKSSTR